MLLLSILVLFVLWVVVTMVLVEADGDDELEEEDDVDGPAFGLAFYRQQACRCFYIPPLSGPTTCDDLLAAVFLSFFSWHAV